MSIIETNKLMGNLLKEIAQIVLDFNLTSQVTTLEVKIDKGKIVSIYPSDYKDYAFVISFDDESDVLDEDVFDIDIEDGILRLMDGERNFHVGLLQEGNNSYFSKDGTLRLFKAYLEVVPMAVSRLINRSSTNIDIEALFSSINSKPKIEPESDYFNHKNSILPYALKQLSVHNFQGIKELQLDEIPVDSQWIFFVGENGFGKTTVLQSIFLGLNGSKDDQTILVNPIESSIQLEYKSIKENFINTIQSNANPLIHLAGYGPGRLNVQGAKSENVEDRNNSISYNLFNSDGFLFNINSDLLIWGLKKDSRFDLVKKAILELVPQIADIKINKKTDQIDYYEQELNTDEKKIYPALPFSKLASGFKSIIALAGDLIVRLSKTQPKVKEPSGLSGIVIIDEIDLHLHPKLQRSLISKFSKVFPKIQFIVSTHSPIPLLGAPENSLIIKVTRTEVEGIKADKVLVDLKNLTPNLILTSGIFDMEDFTSIQNEDLSQVRTEDAFNEMEENDLTDEYLSNFENSNREFPDELFQTQTPNTNK